MDESVLAALAKWPNVPACYDWLELDARGQWRLGAKNTAHREIVRHAGLKNFLGRNYSRTEHGEWFSQNGPQRAYVTLAATPWVIHHINGQWLTHTGAAVTSPIAALIDEQGRAFINTEHGLGIIDDRDLPAFIAQLIRLDEPHANAESILDSLVDGNTSGIALAWQGRCIELQSVDSKTLERDFAFVRHPSTPSPTS